MSKSDPQHIDTIASLSPDDRALLQTGADAVGAHLHLKAGENVAVVHEGKLYFATVSKNVQTAANPFPECPADFCREVQHQIDQYCTAKNLPPGTPVPALRDGKICYCK